MKRLLAAGSGDIYQICKVFRDEERGRWHSPEFTMIEWYRLGFDDAALMSEVEALIGHLLAPLRSVGPAQRLSYRAALQHHAGVDAFSASDAELLEAAARHGISCDAELDRDAKLDLLMGFIVGPRLGRETPCFVCDYPASQAALARLKPGTPRVAARFELYIDGLELANGFHELAQPPGATRAFRSGSELCVACAARFNRRWMRICWRPRSGQECPTAPGSPWVLTAWLQLRWARIDWPMPWPSASITRD